MTTCPCACHTGATGCDRFVKAGGCHDRTPVAVEPAPTPAQLDPERPAGPTYRCRRGDRCAGRVALRDEETRALLGWEPSMPTRQRADGLCVTCEGRLDAALRALPALLVDLDRMVGRDATATPPSDTPSSGSKEQPIPLRPGVEAVRALIEHLTAGWAARVGDAVDEDQLHDDLGPDWDRSAGPRRRLPWRDIPEEWRSQPFDHLAWLREHTNTLLTLGPAPMPVWSAGEHPADWQDLDEVTVGPGRDGPGQLYWADQDGTTGAIALIDAHRRAEQVTGALLPRETTSVGCTRCGSPTMTRAAGESEYRCRRCDHKRPEAHHDVLLQALITSKPETSRPARARQRKERGDTAARAARLAAGRHQHRR